jgi:DHA2 family multidrug resistance protein
MTSGPAAHAPWRPRHNPWLVTLSVMLATFMEVLDTSIANVALPHIAGNLSATNEEATWVLTSYLVSNAIILCAAAWLSTYFGRKKYLAFSVIIFTVSSAMCGLAQTLPQLVGARIIQGIGGGGLQPLAQAIMLECFAPEERGAAMAAYGMGIVVAPIIGPTLGGWITDNYSWRWIFLINIPIGLLGAYMQGIFVEDPPYLAKQRVGRIDYVGFGFMALGIGLLQLVLDKGQEADWFDATWICWASGISVASLLTFVWWELKIKHPIMNLRLLLNRNLSMGCVLMGILGAVLFGTTAILPIFMQTLLGYTALASGMAMTPRGIGSFISMLVVGRIVKLIDTRAIMMAGFLGLAATLMMLSQLNLEITTANIAWPLVLNGMTMGFIFVPLTTLSMATLRQQDIQQGTGIYSLLRNLGASIGISIMVAVQSRLAQGHQVALISHLTPYDQSYRINLAHFAQVLRGWAPLSALGAARGMIYMQAVRQATLLAFVDTFHVLTIICLLVCPFAWVFKKGQGGGGHVAIE